MQIGCSVLPERHAPQLLVPGSTRVVRGASRSNTESAQQTHLRSATTPQKLVFCCLRVVALTVVGQSVNLTTFPNLTITILYSRRQCASHS